MKKTYRSVWISDVHLGSRDAQSELFHHFLDTIRCDNLYLVGDIIDIWALRKTWHWPKQYNEVVHKLLKRARKGARIFFIPGNHDEFFREFIGYTFGDIQVVDDMIHETADGRRFFVTHGDKFDAAVRGHPWMAKLGDWGYRRLVVVNRIYNAIRKRFGKPYFSLSGAIKRKVKGAVTFLNNFEKILAQEAHRREVDGVICGHIHQPVQRMMGDIEYCNAGDWIENCTALVEHDDGTLELIRWHDVMNEDRNQQDGIIPIEAGRNDLENVSAA